ncbi:glutamine dependent NAD(+) synthetase [Trichuris trichiura]|uniref:Glutamine-dependent NAD(+) synthetase n=1 Tax=Trichuris trichiura TaxID=36087 RepID=A0A077YVK4_TRITR|nr:glutamine dependent NAD(+) synthetase [Trichuris trichiura]
MIVSVSCLNQWSLDFAGNYERILQSIEKALRAGARLRVGSELEVCGAGCQDHFFEPDLYLHSLEVLVELIKHPIRGAYFRFFPLLFEDYGVLNDSGLHRESRWFAAWNRPFEVEDYYVPPILKDVTGQVRATVVSFFYCAIWRCCPGNVGYMRGTVGIFQVSSNVKYKIPYANLSLEGIEIFCNSTVHYHELGKPEYSVGMMVESVNQKFGGIYIRANQRGCDGDSVYYDGSSLIAVNGSLVACSDSFSLSEVVRTDSLLQKGEFHNDFSFDFTFCERPFAQDRWYEFAGACWLWDYLRRSGQNGFLLPLSGGMDSSSVACIVASMCHLLYAACNRNGIEFKPESVRDICKRLFFTFYMSGEYSSQQSEANAKILSEDIGATHFTLPINGVVTAFLKTFAAVSQGRLPSFMAAGGTRREDIALQNVQARVRMVLAYLFAQLTLWMSSRPGRLLVLGSSNACESVVGYFTKYDCSSADINPIGSLGKETLRTFLVHCRNKYGYASLQNVLCMRPTAELAPPKEGKSQLDEDDIGLSYQDIDVMNTIRKEYGCGPFTMFCKLLPMWKGHKEPKQIANKVKRYFEAYAANRHKMTTLTPSYHADFRDLEDRRFDQRPFLYNSWWTWQFKKIELEVKAK